MPELQRQAIILREWRGFSYKEIAAELELTDAAVETLIFRARRSLASKLENPNARPARHAALALNFGWLARLSSRSSGSGALPRWQPSPRPSPLSGSGWGCRATRPVLLWRRGPPPASAFRRPSSRWSTLARQKEKKGGSHRNHSVISAHGALAPTVPRSLTPPPHRDSWAPQPPVEQTTAGVSRLSPISRIRRSLRSMTWCGQAGDVVEPVVAERPAASVAQGRGR